MATPSSAPCSQKPLKQAKVKPLVIDYRDLECGVEGTRLGNLDYEDFVAGGDPEFAMDDAGR